MCVRIYLTRLVASMSLNSNRSNHAVERAPERVAHPKSSEPPRERADRIEATRARESERANGWGSESEGDKTRARERWGLTRIINQAIGGFTDAAVSLLLRAVLLFSRHSSPLLHRGTRTHRARSRGAIHLSIPLQSTRCGAHHDTAQGSLRTRSLARSLPEMADEVELRYVIAIPPPLRPAPAPPSSSAAATTAVAATSAPLASASVQEVRETRHDEVGSPPVSPRSRSTIRIGQDDEIEGDGSARVADCQPVALSGWLVKQGAMIKSWKRRYFVLDVSRVLTRRQRALVASGGAVD